MRIAIDTRDLAFATTGTHTYLKELLLALHNRPTSDIRIIELTGLRWGTSLRKPSFFQKMLLQLLLLIWKQFVLPVRCFFSGAQVLICTDYMLPLLPCGAKKMVVFHDALFFDKPEYYPRPWLLYFRTLVLPAAHRAKAIIAPSAFSAARLLDHFPSWSAKLKVIYQGPKQLPEASALSTAGSLVKEQLQDCPYFLHVGTFEKRKNIPFLLEGFAKFSSQRFIKLLLIGLSTGKKNSDDTHQIRATIEQYQLQDRVIVAGYLSDGDLAFFYRRATAYFFPSVYEGFGIPLLEAFMYGLPVAAANATALPEIAGTAALYFDPHDQGSLLACMEQLHAHEPLRKELIEKGYDRAKQFRWSESVEQFVTLAASV